MDEMVPPSHPQGAQHQRCTKGEWNMWGNHGDVKQNIYNTHVKTNHHCPRKTVTFADSLPLYKGHAFSTIIRLCNRHINQYPKEILSAVDLAATDHFMSALYTGTNPQPTTRSVIVGCANGSHMQATATDTLDLPQLPVTVWGCHKFKDISLPLISVPKLCRARCKVNFHQNTVTTTDNRGTEPITGERDPTRNLYMIKVPTQTPTEAHTPNCCGGLYSTPHQGPYPIPPRHDGVFPPW